MMASYEPVNVETQSILKIQIMFFHWALVCYYVHKFYFGTAKTSRISIINLVVILAEEQHVVVVESNAILSGLAFT